VNAVLFGGRQQRAATEERRHAREGVARAHHPGSQHSQRGESLAQETHSVYASPRDREREPTP